MIDRCPHTFVKANYLSYYGAEKSWWIRPLAVDTERFWPLNSRRISSNVSALSQVCVRFIRVEVPTVSHANLQGWQATFEFVFSRTCDGTVARRAK